jgi:hypothetical protein
MIYNTDHYTVVERLTEHPDYPDILKRTKVEDSGLDYWPAIALA